MSSLTQLIFHVSSSATGWYLTSQESNFVSLELSCLSSKRTIFLHFEPVIDRTYYLIVLYKLLLLLKRLSDLKIPFTAPEGRASRSSIFIEPTYINIQLLSFSMISFGSYFEYFLDIFYQVFVIFQVFFHPQIFVFMTP